MGLAEAMGDLQELFTHNFIIGLLPLRRTPALSLRSQGGENDPRWPPRVPATQWKVPSWRVWTDANVRGSFA